MGWFIISFVGLPLMYDLFFENFNETYLVWAVYRLTKVDVDS